MLNNSVLWCPKLLVTSTPNQLWSMDIYGPHNDAKKVLHSNLMPMKSTTIENLWWGSYCVDLWLTARETSSKCLVVLFVSLGYYCTNHNDYVSISGIWIQVRLLFIPCIPWGQVAGYIPYQVTCDGKNCSCLICYSKAIKLFSMGETNVASA